MLLFVTFLPFPQVFAYGQTGTGKTHTMEGSLNDEEQKGVIPRSVDAIFDMLKDPMYSKYSVSVSYLEIYNEELSDLLSLEAGSLPTPRTEAERKAQQNAASADKLQLVEEPPKKAGARGRAFVKNLSEHAVGNPEDVLSLIARAQERRKVGETKMNARSSRSHCVFTLTVVSTRSTKEGGSMEATGKLHLVDLAGSECAKTAGEAGAKSLQGEARERERKNINQSLLTLGRVISTLKARMEKKISTENVRIPYRDSKLTRLLQESLGGRCKTVIIATLSPSVLAVDETFSTLNYAQQAHGIQNKPVATSYLKMNAQLSHGMSFDAKDGIGGDGGRAQDWHEMECRLQYMQSQVDEAQSTLARKHLEQEAIERRAENAERAEKKALDELKAAQAEVAELNSRVEKQETELKVQSFMLATRENTEVRLGKQANTLLRYLERSEFEAGSLHSLLSEAASAADEQTAKREAFVASLSTQLSHAQEHVVVLTSLLSEQRAATLDAANAAEAACSKHASTMRKHSEAMYEAHCAEMRRSSEALSAAKDTTCAALNASCEHLSAEIRSSSDHIKSAQTDLSARIGDVVAKISASQSALSTSLQTAVGRQAAAEEEAASQRRTISSGLQQGAAAVAERLEAERKRFVTHAGALRVLLGEIAQAKSSEADIRKALHVLRKQQSTDCEANAQSVTACIEAVSAASAAQVASQKDGALLSSLGDAEMKLAELKANVTAELNEQHVGLSTALNVQKSGNAAEKHAAALLEALADVESAGAKRIAEINSATAKLADQQAGLQSMLSEQATFRDQMKATIMAQVESALAAQLGALAEKTAASVSQALAHSEDVVGVGVTATEGTKAALASYAGKCDMLLSTAATWGASNDDVANRIEKAIQKSTDAVDGLASAHGEVAGAHTASVGLVHEWAASDGECRNALSAANVQQREAINTAAAAAEARAEQIEQIDHSVEGLEELSEAAEAQLTACSADVDTGVKSLEETMASNDAASASIGEAVKVLGETSAASRKTEANALSSINVAAAAAATQASDALATALASADAHAKAHAAAADSQAKASADAARALQEALSEYKSSEEAAREAAQKVVRTQRDLEAGEANLLANATAASREARESAVAKDGAAQSASLDSQQAALEGIRTSASCYADDSTRESVAVPDRIPLSFTEPFACTAAESVLREHYATNGPAPLESSYTPEPASPSVGLRRRSLEALLPKSASKRLSIVDMAALSSLTVPQLKSLACEHELPSSGNKTDLMNRLAKAGIKAEGAKTPRSTPRRAAKERENNCMSNSPNADAGAPPALKKNVSSSSLGEGGAAEKKEHRPSKLGLGAKGTGIRGSRSATVA